MPQKHFPQALADQLFTLEKHRVDETAWIYPAKDQRLQVPLASEDGREEFILDIKRYTVNLARRTYQNRARKDVVLARLDIEGPDHENPDGTVVPPPHIHVYRQGYGDKWAYPLPEAFDGISDIVGIFEAFLSHCNVVTRPTFQYRMD